ncbi:MAG: hypothetical protein WCU88_10010 [Elusimicrobiota bacterium]|jgi:hypothetical protein
MMNAIRVFMSILLVANTLPLSALAADAPAAPPKKADAEISANKPAPAQDLSQGSAWRRVVSNGPVKDKNGNERPKYYCHAADCDPSLRKAASADVPLYVLTKDPVGKTFSAKPAGLKLTVKDDKFYMSQDGGEVRALIYRDTTIEPLKLLGSAAAKNAAAAAAASSKSQTAASPAAGEKPAAQPPAVNPTEPESKKKAAQTQSSGVSVTTTKAPFSDWCSAFFLNNKMYFCRKSECGPEGVLSKQAGAQAPLFLWGDPRGNVHDVSGPPIIEVYPTAYKLVKDGQDFYAINGAGKKVGKLQVVPSEKKGDASFVMPEDVANGSKQAAAAQDAKAGKGEKSPKAAGKPSSGKKGKRAKVDAAPETSPVAENGTTVPAKAPEAVQDPREADILNFISSTDRTEQALILFLADKENPQTFAEMNNDIAALKALQADKAKAQEYQKELQAFNEKWNKKATAKAREILIAMNNNQPMPEWLKNRGITKINLEDYYCKQQSQPIPAANKEEEKPASTGFWEENVGRPLMKFVGMDGKKEEKAPADLEAEKAASGKDFDGNGDPADLCGPYFARIKQMELKSPKEKGLHIDATPEPTLIAGEPKIGDKNRDSAQKEKDDAERAKLMKELKRDAIGGAFGAVGFGILGMIFGGPVGMFVGAAVGFGIMAGVTHLNNNPIK